MYILISTIYIYIEAIQFTAVPDHPEPCKTGLVYGQALRVVERCTDEQEASSHLKNLKAKFLERKYPENLVDKQINKAEKRDRKCECKAIATVFPCIHESPSTSSVEKYGRNVSCSQRSVFGEVIRS